MNKNEIRLIVITTGEDVEDSFNIHEPLRVVKMRAITKEQPGANPDLFHLEFNDQVLDETRKIEDYIQQFGWIDGTTLELVSQPEVVHGGS
jgi:hypothetical protein